MRILKTLVCSRPSNRPLQSPKKSLISSYIIRIITFTYFIPDSLSIWVKLRLLNPLTTLKTNHIIWNSFARREFFCANLWQQQHSLSEGCCCSAPRAPLIPRRVLYVIWATLVQSSKGTWNQSVYGREGLPSDLALCSITLIYGEKGC